MRVLLIVGGMLAGGTLWGLVEAQTKKPVITQEIHEGFLTPPDSITHMIAESDAVVVARYIDSRAIVWEGRHPATVRRFEVMAFIKSHALLSSHGASFEITFLDGDYDRGGHVERVTASGFDRPIDGRTYVMFLHRLPGPDRWGLLWGPATMYDIGGEHVRSLSQKPRLQDGKRVPEFLSELGFPQGLPPGR